MKVVVIGGTGLVGSKVVNRLTDLGHTVVAASPSRGVNAITGEGLSAALDGAAVVVDVSNSPSFEYDSAREFFETSTRNLRAAELSGGVGHHVCLSVVGTELLSESGYFRAKIVQEELVKASAIPYTIVRATQFFEFVDRIVDAATEGISVRLASVLFQPMAADDVAAAVETAAMGEPVNGIIETGGPERVRLDDFVRRVLADRDDPREVVTDPQARYFGAVLGERTLVPADDAPVGDVRFNDWREQ